MNIFHDEITNIQKLADGAHIPQLLADTLQSTLQKLADHALGAHPVPEVQEPHPADLENRLEHLEEWKSEAAQSLLAAGLAQKAINDGAQAAIESLQIRAADLEHAILADKTSSELPEPEAQKPVPKTTKSGS
jgi:hypothetical protein